MSTTNKTSEYQLSQVEQNDVPSWIADYSADMAKIDAALAHNRNNVSSKFSEDTDYIKGNYCIKDDVLYKFTDAKPAGAWDSSKVEAVTVEGELEAHATAISEQNVNIKNVLCSKRIGTVSSSNPISVKSNYGATYIFIGVSLSSKRGLFAYGYLSSSTNGNSQVTVVSNDSTSSIVENNDSSITFNSTHQYGFSLYVIAFTKEQLDAIEIV